MKIDELLSKGLIRREKIDGSEISGSISLAEKFLERGRGNFDIRYYDVAFLLAYTAMFHAARALLFKAGFNERSHFGLIQALKGIYDDEELNKYLNVLDSYRMSRHAVQYSGESSSEQDATSSLDDAGRFIKIAKRVLNK
ncbi:MAG: HEPN domain-containing protein [Candidatus Micrarchaeota archaeon]|nr:HEPN domain-containing protein [Candidatus Micrarchaeota archaeon]